MMTTCLTSGKFGTCQASNLNPMPNHLLIISKVKYNPFSVPKQKLGAFSSSLRLENGTRRKMDVVVYCSAQPEPQPPSDPSPDSRKVSILETIVRIISSFWRDKKELLLELKEKAESTIDTAEHVADVVEEVAENVEKVAEGAASHLPEGKLQDLAESVEKVAEEIDRNANEAEDALQKVEEVEKEVESFVKPTSSQENQEKKAQDQN